MTNTKNYRSISEKVMFFCVTLFFLSIPLLATAASDTAGENVPCVLSNDLLAEFPCSVLLVSRDRDLPGMLATLRDVDGSMGLTAPSVHVIEKHVPTLQVLKVLQANPRIELIPNHIINSTAAPAGKGGNKESGQIVPAGINRIGATPGSLPFTGNGIGVAILDTGLDFNHVDLAPAPDCYDAFGGDCQDVNGHGTHVGGIVAARNNVIDTVGVAADATLYAVKVLGDNGSGTDASIMAGLQWVIDYANTVVPAIKVINMSLSRAGQVEDNSAMHEMFQVLTGMGISIVVSAGNDPEMETTQRIPAAYPEVISVASTTALDGNNKCRSYSGFIAADSASAFATDGPAVSISAPGEKQEDIDKTCAGVSIGILSLQVGGGTTRKSGSSMATPLVSGVIALLHEQQQLVEPEAMRSALQVSAEGVGVYPKDSPFSSYTFDGVREGVLSACAILGVACQ